MNLFINVQKTKAISYFERIGLLIVALGMWKSPQVPSKIITEILFSCTVLYSEASVMKDDCLK